MALLNNPVGQGGFFSGIDAIKQRVFPKKPRGSDPEEVRDILANSNDFVDGFVIQEYQNGKLLVNETVKLIGIFMPHQPFGFGGKQRLSKNYYPGNSEPTVQVLGAEETNIQIKGRFYDKKFTGSRNRAVADFTKDDAEVFPYGIANEFQKQINAIRVRGNLVRITMGEFRRYGFIEEVKFDMKTLGDIEYTIDFLIVGVNPPKECKAIDRSKDLPLTFNKQLINAAANFTKPPVTMPKSFADSINGLLSDVASAVALVTTFVDGTLQEVDDIKSGVTRAIGLCKYARNKALSYVRIVGAFPAFIDPQHPGVGIASFYTHASFVAGSLGEMFSLTALLAAMQKQLREISKTVPLARHKVLDEDTLQKISQKFYGTQDNWKIIYDHNKLQSTILSRGTVLEIPRT